MKPQLLEDIGDSQSAIDARFDLPTPAVQAIPRKPAPAPLPRSHFGVWRDRQLEEARVAEEPLQTPVDEAPANEPAQEERIAADEDITIEPNAAYLKAVPATQKGSRLAAWTAAAVALALVAGGSLWLYKDRRDETTLAMLANKLETAPAIAAAMPVATLPAPQPPPAAAPEKIPPMVMLDPEQVAKPEPEPEPEAVAEVEVPPAKPVAAPVVKKPAKALARMRQVRKTPVAKDEPRRAAVKAEKPLAAAPAGDFSKACRALGYQDSQCRKRACVLTRFGMACRG